MNRLVQYTGQAFLGVGMVTAGSLYALNILPDALHAERATDEIAQFQADNFLANVDRISTEASSFADNLDIGVRKDYGNRFGAACTALIMYDKTSNPLDQLADEVDCFMSDDQIEEAREANLSTFTKISELRGLEDKDAPFSTMSFYVNSAESLADDNSNDSSRMFVPDDFIDAAKVTDVALAANGEVTVSYTENQANELDIIAPAGQLVFGLYFLASGLAKGVRELRSTRKGKKHTQGKVKQA